MKNKKDKIKIFLAEDHLAVLNALKTILDSEDDFEVVDVATDGKAALEKIEETNPDVAVVAVKMPLINGLKVTERVKKYNPYIEVILISMFDEYKDQIEKVGAHSFIQKGEPVKNLIKNIRLAYLKKSQQ